MTPGQPHHAVADDDGAVGAPLTPDHADVIYAIGDIHGRYDLLRDLLDQVARDADALPPHQNVTCVFLGDYVDRGPDSAAVLGALVWLERNAPFDCIFLRGNHEQTMLDYIADPVATADWLRFGGADTLRSYGIDVPEVVGAGGHARLREALLDALPAAHLDFLGRLPTRHETDHNIFVHAGLRPGVPLSAQTDDDLMWIREDFLTSDAGFGKQIVYGHTWTSDLPQVAQHRVGLDTGAYRTGVLTAGRFIGTSVEFLRSTGHASLKNAGSSDRP